MSHNSLKFLASLILQWLTSFIKFIFIITSKKDFFSTFIAAFLPLHQHFFSLYSCFNQLHSFLIFSDFVQVYNEVKILSIAVLVFWVFWYFLSIVKSLSIFSIFIFLWFYEIVWNFNVFWPGYYLLLTCLFRLSNFFLYSFLSSLCLMLKFFRFFLKIFENCKWFLYCLPIINLHSTSSASHLINIFQVQLFLAFISI